MKNKIKYLKLISFVLINGFIIMGCSLFFDDEVYLSLEGEWKSGTIPVFIIITFIDNNFIYDNLYFNGPVRGTFTSTSTHIMFNMTQWYNTSEGRWVNRSPSGIYQDFDGRSIPYMFTADGNGLQIQLSRELIQSTFMLFFKE